MRAVMELSFLKLQKSFFNLYNKWASINKLKALILIFTILFFVFSFNRAGATASDEEVELSILLDSKILKKGDNLGVRIFVENRSTSDIQIDKILFISKSNSEVSSNVIVAASSEFEQEYIVQNLTTEMTSVAFVLYYHYVGDTNKHIKFSTSEIEVQNRINLDWVLYLITWFFGVLSAVFSSEIAKRWADARTKRQYEKDQINISLHKALSFLAWAEKIALNPTMKVDMFWEKVFMEGDTLLYLQKASVRFDDSKELTSLTTDIISLLLLIQRLGERLNEQDIYSGITKSLQAEIDASAKDLKDRVMKLLPETS